MQRHGQRIQAAALVHINEVQADGFVANANLARARLAHGHVNELELFGAAVFFDDDCFGHEVLLQRCEIFKTLNPAMKSVSRLSHRLFGGSGTVQPLCQLFLML